MSRSISIVAIQPALVLGEVERNLERLEVLIREAYWAHRPDLIVLPEAMTSPNVYDPAIRAVPRPIDGAPLQMMSLLADELGCVIGGGCLSVRGRNAYGTYMLIEPDGRAHLHDKDIPSGTENFFNAGGDDDGVTAVAAWDRRRVGLASGMEWARVRTAERLRTARVQVVIGGQCWPWTPENWRGPIGRWSRAQYARSRRQCRELPATMARLVGAPTVMASHVGPVTMRTPFAPRIGWDTHMVGETQICDRDGTSLARLGLEDGEGYICAQVELDDPQPSDALPDGYWTTDITAPITVAFHGSNAIGAAAYRIRTRRGGYPWQDAPGTDLPDEGPPRPKRSERLTRAAALGAQASIPVVVASRTIVAEDVVHLRLRTPDGSALPAWKPGAHIDLLLGDDGGTDLIRQYSLCGRPADGHYEVAVLRERDGRGGSDHVHDKIGEGDRLAVRGPRNHFELGTADSYLFIAGGIGITPLLPMIDHVATRGCRWRLVYGGRSATSMAFVSELVSRHPDSVQVHPQDADGLLDLPAILAARDPSAPIYCCGPEPLLAAVEALCTDLPPGLLHTERFLPRQLSGIEPNAAFDIELARSARTLRVPVHGSVLTALLDAGVELDYSCQTGVCGTCQVGVLAGTPDHRDSITTQHDPLRDQRMMTCVSRAVTASLTLDI